MFALFLQQATLTPVNVASITRKGGGYDKRSHHTFETSRHRYAQGGSDRGNRQRTKNKFYPPKWRAEGVGAWSLAQFRASRCTTSAEAREVKTNDQI